MKNHSGPVYVTKFSPDGLYLLSGSQDRTITLWNPFKALPIKTYSGNHNYEILDVCVTPDNNR
jgi:WD40 repeat protein